MSAIVSINQNETEIRITINAPVEAVRAAVNMIAEDFGLDLELTEQEHVDSIAQSTKQWWFDKARAVNKLRVERAAKQLGEQYIEDGIAAFENSPLKGA